MSGTSNRNSIIRASVITILLLVGWWFGLIYVDGLIAQSLPYHQYEVVTLLYPEVYYLGLPGWFLAGILPSPLGVYFTILSTLILFSFGIGFGATVLANRTRYSSTAIAVAAVFTMYIVFAVFEEIVPRIV